MSVQPDQLREPSREQLEAAAKVMNDEGFDIRFPWECTLDDVEQHRYETFSKAIAAALPPSATGAAEPNPLYTAIPLQRATPPVRGDREAIANLLEKMVERLDRGTDDYTIQCRETADAILSLPVQPGAGERS